MRHPRCFGLLLCSILTTGDSFAADPTAAATPRIEAAIRRALPRLEQGAAGSAKQRQCFTCHNQALPALALAEAHRKGFSIDRELFAKQIQHTVEHLRRGREQYLAGKGQGGRVITAGYALWTLQAGAYPADALTTAVTGFLLQYQQEADHWSQPGSRPPSTGSDFTTTYVALRGLQGFGAESQQERIATRRKSVQQWLSETAPEETEDRVFALRALKLLGAEAATIKTQVDALLQEQRNDGGWAQTTELGSDAYASGSVLTALLRDGGLPATQHAVRRGIDYLLKLQQPDGTWHTKTRANPFQTYYESGFPHGKDQFISIAASSWATLALVLTLPDAAADAKTRAE